MPFFRKIGLSILLLVLTFPVIRPAFSLQIDPQIHWVFNYLWQHDFGQTQQLIFPHGPLTFINFPLAMGSNLFWGALLQALLRFFFIYTFLFLGEIVNPKRWWVNGIVAFFLLEFMDLEFIVAGGVVNVLFLNYETRRVFWFLLAVILATLGFYIKISIGIISFSMIVPFAFYLFFEKESSTSYFQKTKNLLLRLTAIPLTLTISWLLMYRDFDFFGKYFYGVLELVKGNSDSASLYPDNNWWLLGGCFICFFLIPFVPFDRSIFSKNKKTWLVYFVMGFSVFAVWKHGMARQDPWHIIKIFSWLMVFFSYVFIFNKKIKPLTILFSLASLLFFYGNIKSSVGMFVDEFGTDGYKNFAQTFLHQKDLFQESQTASNAKIQVCKLSENDLQLIGTLRNGNAKTVDCYPWNYAYIAANDLKWQPRPVIQSYAAYTPWLDLQNAQHFSSAKAPEFLIWETDILQRDPWEGELTSIDNRYLLNDEPQTVAAIFTHYKTVSKGNGYILLQKNKTRLLQNPLIKKTIQSEWNNWISVPEFGEGILRAKINFQETFLKWLKAKTYKDEPLFIEYFLENGAIKKYRFTAENATQGLWLHPFIIRPSDHFINPMVTKFRLSCGNDFLVENNLEVDFELLLDLENDNEKNDNPFDKKNNNTFTLFGKDVFREEKVILRKDDLVKEEIILLTNGYSPAYEISLNELLTSTDSTANFAIAASVEAKISYHAKALLVIVLEDDGEVILWEKKSVEDFMSIYHRWEMAFLKRKIPANISQKTKLKVYVWNTGREEILIRRMKIKVLKIE